MERSALVCVVCGLSVRSLHGVCRYEVTLKSSSAGPNRRHVRREYVALLRAIAHVPMSPFRQALEELGFADVDSYGMSGNVLFNARRSATTSLERRVDVRLQAVSCVRTRSELARVVAGDPFGDDPRAAIMFLARLPTRARRREFQGLDFEEPRPVLRGKTLYFVYPALLRGRRTAFDFERFLGVRGTARSGRVVKQLLALMEAR